MDATKKHLFVIENPLLDIQVQMSDKSILDKYELGLGMACLAEEKHMPLYGELWDHKDRMVIPGGSGLNSARSANFILKNQDHSNKVVYFGSIADDTYGQILEKNVGEEGVEAKFHKCTEAPTGSCGVIVVDKERTMVANLAAACKYDHEHLNKNLEYLKNSSLIYSTSFFITSNV